MKELTNKELSYIIGGSISGALLSNILKGVQLVFDLGRSLGNTIRRMIIKKYC